MTTWAIPEALNAEIRRVLGYPDLLSQASLQAHYPNFASEFAIFQPYAQLESKLAVLQNSAAEAVPIFGQAHPAFGTFYVPASFTVPLASPSSPTTGAKVSVSVGGATVSASASSGNSVLDVANALVTALGANIAISPLVIASVQSVDAQHANVILYATEPGTLGNGISVVATTTDPSLTVASIGPVLAGVTSGGHNPPGPTIPLTTGGVGQTILYGYLPIILQLESDLGGGRQFLSFTQAEVIFRSDELTQRLGLLNRYRRELADRLSVPLDPDITGNRSRRGASRIV